MLRAIDKYLEGRRETILDVGCQNAFFLRLSSMSGFKRFIGVDFFEMPKDRSFLPGLEGGEFVQANFNEPAFLSKIPNGSVDCVSSTEVFEHLLNHPMGYMKECWRVLRPGGVLLFTTPNPATLANAWRLLRGIAITWGDKAFANVPKFTADNKPAAFWDIHFREYVHDDLMEIFKELPGLKILESGFLVNAPDSAEPATKRLTKALVWKAGLGYWRPMAATQFFILRRTN
jgi:SAM-dependent methyltransferase